MASVWGHRLVAWGACEVGFNTTHTIEVEQFGGYEGGGKEQNQEIQERDPERRKKGINEVRSARCEGRPFGRKQWWSLVPAVYRTQYMTGFGCGLWVRGRYYQYANYVLGASAFSVGSKMFPSADEIAQIPR